MPSARPVHERIVCRRATLPSYGVVSSSVSVVLVEPFAALFAEIARLDLSFQQVCRPVPIAEFRFERLGGVQTDIEPDVICEP